MPKGIIGYSDYLFVTIIPYLYKFSRFANASIFAISFQGPLALPHAEINFKK